ncbi:MAG: glycosyltransferase family 1 protein [Clostridiaceae bacterium]|nr:glycosyltransferase family 1 protein [Clostridiaceae bacterium]
MLVTSDTVIKQEYFTNGWGALYGKSVEDWKNKIQYYLQHTEEANNCAKAFKNFFETECSEEKYAKTLWRMLVDDKKI